MALASRFYVERGVVGREGKVDGFDVDSVHEGFDAANERAVALVAGGVDKAAVRVITGLAFDDSHEIEPADEAPRL